MIIYKRVDGWTEGRFRSFIMGVIRKGLSRFPNKFIALENALVGQRINKKSGRMAKHYKCNSCNKEFPLLDVEVDHINPIVPVTGFLSWDDIIDRAFCSVEGYQVLCKSCHKIKSGEENSERKRIKDGTKESKTKTKS